MARIKRKEIKFTEESLNELYQEIYNDSHNIRSRIVALFEKWEVLANEQGEIAATGKEIVSVLNLFTKNQDQKINLLKVLAEIVRDNKTTENKKKELDITLAKLTGESVKNTDAESSGSQVLSDDFKNQIRQIVENQKSGKQ